MRRVRFRLGDAGGANGVDEVVSTINTTPLVDVMLVLLIIFLITIPAVNYAVPVSLPQERNDLLDPRPENIVISIGASGQLYWMDEPVNGIADVADRLRLASRIDPQPEVQIRGDEQSAYRPVGEVVAACREAGLFKISFLVQPPVSP